MSSYSLPGCAPARRRARAGRFAPARPALRRADYRVARRTARECPVKEPARKTPSEARASHIGQSILLVAENGLRGADAAPHRRSDAFAHVASRESRRIARHKGVVDPDEAHVPAQIITVSRRLVARASRKGASEPLGEPRPVRLDVLPARLDPLRHAANADVEPAVRLRDVPGIPG